MRNDTRDDLRFDSVLLGVLLAALGALDLLLVLDGGRPATVTSWVLLALGGAGIAVSLRLFFAAWTNRWPQWLARVVRIIDLENLRHHDED